MRHLHLQQPTSTERCEALGCDVRCTLSVDTTKHTLLHAPTVSCSETSLLLRVHTHALCPTHTCPLMLKTPPPQHHGKITQLMHGEERVCATPTTSHTHAHTCKPQVADGTQVKVAACKANYTQQTCTAPPHLTPNAPVTPRKQLPCRLQVRNQPPHAPQPAQTQNWVHSDQTSGFHSHMQRHFSPYAHAPVRGIHQCKTTHNTSMQSSTSQTRKTQDPPTQGWHKHPHSGTRTTAGVWCSVRPV